MILTGPILQFLGCQDGVWGLSLLIVCEAADPQPDLRLTGAAELVNGASGPVPGLAATAWRFDIAVRQTASVQRFAYRLAGQDHSVQVPALGATPVMAYVSCNGFSDARARKSVKTPNALWARLDRLHRQQERVEGIPAGPLELLLMGGDQIYSDDIWASVPELRAWTEVEWFTRTHMPMSDSLRATLQTRFAECYLERWNQPETAALLASVPSVMMWDDHDIIDGWGSHPAELHNSPVLQGLFEVAKAAFELFQRQMLGAPPPATLPDQSAHSSACRFGSTGLLVLDLRSERRPRSETTDAAGRKTVLPDQVMSPASWSAVYAWLDAQLAAGDLRHLLVMSSIPVMHPSFEQLEKMLGALPAIEELEDDLRDHWTSHPHQAERLRLVRRLLDASARGLRVTVLSGDVHVAAIGVIESDRSDLSPEARSLTQLTSSGVTHPPPAGVARYFLEEACKQTETLEPGLTGQMVAFPTARRRLIGCRNFMTLQADVAGGADRLWVNWWAEGVDHPFTKVVLPVG
ncbi:alkaline phosphatase D family protein [Hydrogenophaga sp.]|uniref:alkaline phosphatase D family protein n=1 Tax=Hydrogenophaga sp. TaxID=1904254 RepID=UPI0035AE745A